MDASIHGLSLKDLQRFDVILGKYMTKMNVEKEEDKFTHHQDIGSRDI